MFSYTLYPLQSISALCSSWLASYLFDADFHLNLLETFFFLYVTQFPFLFFFFLIFLRQCVNFSLRKNTYINNMYDGEHDGYWQLYHILFDLKCVPLLLFTWIRSIHFIFPFTSTGDVIFFQFRSRYFLGSSLPLVANRYFQYELVHFIHNMKL